MLHGEFGVHHVTGFVHRKMQHGIDPLERQAEQYSCYLCRWTSLGRSILCTCVGLGCSIFWRQRRVSAYRI